LRKSLLHDYLIDMYETQASVAIRQERADDRKRRRHGALVRSKANLLSGVAKEQASLKKLVATEVGKELTGTDSAAEEETVVREAEFEAKSSEGEERVAEEVVMVDAVEDAVMVDAAVVSDGGTESSGTPARTDSDDY
jgi:hypothetical protein